MSETTEWQFSSVRMTVWIRIVGRVVIDAAPIVRKFIGQDVENLELWMMRQGIFRRSKLRTDLDQRLRSLK